MRSASGQGQISLQYEGGLYIGGVLDPNNTAVSPEAKARIAELVWVRTGSDDDRGSGASSAGKMKSQEGK